MEGIRLLDQEESCAKAEIASSPVLESNAGIAKKKSILSL